MEGIGREPGAAALGRHSKNTWCEGEDNRPQRGKAGTGHVLDAWESEAPRLPPRSTVDLKRSHFVPPSMQVMAPLRYSSGLSQLVPPPLL